MGFDGGKKVFVFGLDGATFDLIGPWAEKGELPNFKKMMSEGVYGTLNSTLPPLTPPAWTSSLTGKNPGKHNIFDFFKPDPKSYHREIVSVHDRRSKAIWNILSDCGKKVGVFNVPITYPPEKVNGFVVTGMLTPSGESDFAYPPALKDELLKKVNYQVEIDLRSLVKGDEHAFLRGLSEGTENRKSALFYLLEKSEWDLFVAVFEALDLVQHFFWRFMDEKHPQYGSDDAVLRNAIRDLYRQMDQHLGDLLNAIGDECAVVVYSDHGFRPLYKDVYIYNWLEEKGFLRLKWNREGLKSRCLKSKGFPPRWMKHLIIKDHLGQSKSISAVDWSATKAYFFSLSGQSIRVNLKGREPEGIVNDGNEYEALRERLIRELDELRDPETGAKVVEKVFKREEIYSGNFVSNGPDLVVETGEGYVLQEGFGEDLMMEAKQFQAIRSGNHHPKGIFLARGRGIRKGAPMSASEIVDITPTLLHLMGIPIPRDLDGKVLKEAFEPGYLEANPIQYGGETEIYGGGDYEYSQEEKEEMERRLRGLKYME